MKTIVLSRKYEDFITSLPGYLKTEQIKEISKILKSYKVMHKLVKKQHFYILYIPVVRRKGDASIPGKISTAIRDIMWDVNKKTGVILTNTLHRYWRDLGGY